MPRLLISDHKGNISLSTSLEATGMKGGSIFALRVPDLIRLPEGSKLFILPARSAIGQDRKSNYFVSIKDAYSVAAFLAPGYTATFSAAFTPIGRPKRLPLFSYAAVCEYKGSLYTTAIRIDKDRRHDCRYINMEEVRGNAARFAKLFRGNRLIAHLKDCALTYGCPNARNFFLSRFEAPLPASGSCNAFCTGCISFQPEKKCPVSQPRIKFVPTAEELSDIAVYHIAHSRRPIVSFGQGCEGEPLLQYKLIETAIASIRKKTSRGTIHMNTNGSMSDELARLIDSGLDSVRISFNSAKGEYYNRYYKPRGYSFKDVMNSISIAKKKRSFVSVNYLTMPGFTDTKSEFKAMRALVSKGMIDMIQWRNLNYDPLRYFEEIKFWPSSDELIGINTVIDSLQKEFSRLRMGYFNPSLH